MNESKMPTLTAQAITDERAIHVLRDILPFNWLLNERKRDFGIDFDVEIFEDHKATGMRFSLQLKGTKQSKKVPSVSGLKRTTLNYWKANDLPTLLVLINVETHEAWVQWSHHIDLYDSKASPTSRTVTVKFGQADAWVAESPEQLLAEVKAHRARRGNGTIFPIRVDLGGSPVVRGMQTRQIVAPIQEFFRLRKGFHVSSIDDGKSTLVLSAQLSSDVVKVSLSGDSPIYLHLNEAMEKTSHVRWQNTLRADISAALSFKMATAAALTEVAADLLEQAVELSEFIVSDPKAMAFASEILSESQRYEGAGLLLRRMLRRADETGRIFVTVIVQRREQYDFRYRMLVATSVLTATHSLPPLEAAPLAYNASLIAQGIDWEFVVLALQRAAQIDPSYKNRGYWWGELGGAYFHISDLPASRDAYEHAVALGETSCVDLLADVEFYLGHYDDATVRWRANHGGADREEWELKTWVLEKLRLQFDLPRQDRDRDGSIAALEGASLDRLVASREALELDLLNPRALTLFAEHSESLAAKSPFLLAAALSNLHDPELWRSALVELAEQNLQLLESAAAVGIRLCGEPLLELAQDRGDPEVVLKALKAAASARPRRVDSILGVRATKFGASDFEMMEERKS